MDELEPLKNIRQAEVNVIRRVALAQEAAERIRSEAQTQTAVILDAARARAESDGQALKSDILAQGRTEEQAILEIAEQRVHELTARGQAQVARAVTRALRFLLSETEG